MFENTIKIYFKELNPIMYNKMVKEGTFDQTVTEMNARMEKLFETILGIVTKKDQIEEEDRVIGIGKINMQKMQKYQAIEIVQEMIESEVKTW